MKAIKRFHSEREFETALCTSCARKGYAERTWPLTPEFWPVSGGKLLFDRCKACKAELDVEHRRRKAA